MKYNYHKFHAVKTIRNGLKFDSKLEADYYDELKLRVLAGEVIFFLRQIAFDLPGNTKYRCDFQEFWADGTVHFIDCKGYETKDFIKNKKQVEALYPVEIEVKYKGSK